MTAGHDLCVLGAGPGGFAAAMRALDLGKRVLLVERERVGGAGIHRGALSSKTLWHLANDYAVASRTDRGYQTRGLEVSLAAVMETVHSAVAERQGQMERQIEALADAAETGPGRLQFLRGSGRFLSPDEIEVVAADGQVSRHTVEHTVIATGSRPRLPAGVEIDGARVVTSDQIEDWTEFPASLVIVGAGVIGCEYATIFGHFGKTQIHLIDQQPRILPFEDADVAQVVARQFTDMGIRVHSESRLQSLRVVDGQVEFVVTRARGGETATETIRVERALYAIGREPALTGLGLERAGVQLTPSGGILVEGTRTTAPGIHAVGDTTLDIALANVAELEGRHAVEDLFAAAPTPIRYEALTSIMFLAPELAAVGLNEQQARRKGVRYRFGVVDNRLSSRAIAMRSTAGFVKLLAAPDSGRLLGLRVIGPQASSTAQGVALLIDHGGTLEDIDRCIHPHPAIPEAVQECARLLLGRSVNRAAVLGESFLRIGEG